MLERDLNTIKELLSFIHTSACIKEKINKAGILVIYTCVRREKDVKAHIILTLDSSWWEESGGIIDF